MKSGAFDFLEKPIDDELLLDVLKSAIREDLLRHEEHRSENLARSRLDRLTTREREVLDLLTTGLSQREIAARLEISPRTVEVYKARTMEKLQCRTLPELVHLAIAARSASPTDI
jgi:RNA polymerase sigma factor (sigma-70 family)